jgi:glucose-6-phosphate dehydrogenase assembly protein OpcA
MTSGTQSSFAEMHPVAIEGIEQQLDNLWREANAGVSAASGHAVARNTVMTLVVVTRNPDEAREALDIVHQLNAEHPSRAIVLAPAGDHEQHDSPPPGTAGIEAFAATYVGPNSCYGEDIVLLAHGDAIRHLPGVVLPLILSGLPSFLWWTGEPPWGSEMLEALVDGCDRFVVDTSAMEHPDRSLRALEDLLRRKAARCAIGDVCWTVQAPWRDIVAQFFDPADVLVYLETVDRLTIEYAAGDEDQLSISSQAYLFAGWLASRLGWRINLAQPVGIDGNRQHNLRDASGRVVTLEINARYGVPLLSSLTQQHMLPEEGTAQQQNAQAVRPGALMSVYIASRNEGQLATFAVARERDLAHATTACQVPGIALPSQTVHLQSLGESGALAQQLANLGHDPIYEEALQAGALMIGASGRKGL